MTWLAGYHFDDTGSVTVVDATGHGYDIDLTGQPAAQVASSGALDGGALGKTGSGLIPMPAALQTAAEADDRTIMFDAVGLRSVWWVRFSSASLGTGVFGMLSLNATDVLSRARTQANVGPSQTITIGALSASVRHNFALTYQRATGVLTGYYDGVVAGTATFTPGTQLYVGADDFDIAEWSSTGPAMDNLRIADHCADAVEIAALAGTPVVADATPINEAAVTIPLQLSVGAAGNTPPATIAEAEFSIDLTLDAAPAADTPPVPIPTASLEIPLQLSASFSATTPVATVPQASLSLGLLLDVAPAGVAEPRPATTEVGGWEVLGDIARWNAQQREYERSAPPVACPDHGDPLETRDGLRHCPMGHFV